MEGCDRPLLLGPQFLQQDPPPRQALTPQAGHFPCHLRPPEDCSYPRVCVFRCVTRRPMVSAVQGQPLSGQGDDTVRRRRPWPMRTQCCSPAGVQWSW